MSRRSSLQASQPTPSSTPLTTRVISQGVVLLENLDQQRYAKRSRYSTVLADEPDEPDGLDSNSPIYESFLASQGVEGIVTMTNFSPSEFNLIWTEKGGDVVAAVFKQKPTTFEKRVMPFLIVLHPYLMRPFVTAVEQKWPMQALAESGHRFKNFLAVRYATDVTFQQTHVPAGATKFYKSSVSDKTIFDENIDSHLVNRAKRIAETTLEDSEPGAGHGITPVFGVVVVGTVGKQSIDKQWFHRSQSRSRTRRW
ncbi:hypothetical protein H257_18687 [Aphanomyces astaci]|uniref:Uncharacterized protein n=1 Tax=Aphanomyces astaci TaxID=112090 RepID=W4FBX7_APHAT|nr:hypothetical protein H257_18687 [Aphanomyces astaci]ETV64424.1 hypothetical protein H257_18687 [Aphanomyces astaci]|eukprot:XP_009846091.1 hypothetical protein H257_18687 [Aphanomyces astaci]